MTKAKTSKKNKTKQNCLFLLKKLSSLFTCFGTVVINDWKIIFDIAIVLKITIFPSSIRFFIFYIFNACSISVTVL